jgi:hypothetical protein
LIVAAPRYRGALDATNRMRPMAETGQRMPSDALDA